MRNGRHVTNNIDSKSSRLQGPKRGLTARSWPFDLNLHRSHSRISSLPGSVLGSNLSSERCSFARSLEPHSPSARPRNYVPLQISNSNNGIVKGRVDIDEP